MATSVTALSLQDIARDAAAGNDILEYLELRGIRTAATLALLNKVDLAPHCDVDLDLYEANLKRVNPGIEGIRVSARTGEGLDQWIGWLWSQAHTKSQAKRHAKAAE
jgi:Ni2+-binding GTPase involved in maturation of urease and hydrogenase